MTTTRPATVCTCVEPRRRSNRNRKAAVLVCQRCLLLVDDQAARAPREARAVPAPAVTGVTADGGGQPRCHRCGQTGMHGGDGTECIRALHAALAVVKFCAA